MSGARATIGAGAGVAGFIVLVLAGIGAAMLGILFVFGAPHALPASPGLAAIFFLITLSCWAAAIVLLRRSVRTLSSSSATQKQARLRKSLYVIAVGALVLVLVTIAFPFFYEPVRPAQGSVARGDFMVEPTLRSSCSPEAHRVFYEGRVITKVAGNTIISPRNPSRLLYTVACAHDESQSGIFYFGGGSVAPVQANPLGLYEIGDWIDKYWSPDDRFVIVPSSGHATLVNLQTGRRSAFLGELFERKDAFSSGVSFRGWSPDGKRFAVVISASQMREDRSLDQEFDLVAVDPDTLAPTYVATKRSDDWKNNEFKWAANELAVDAGAPSGSIYHKAR